MWHCECVAVSFITPCINCESFIHVMAKQKASVAWFYFAVHIACCFVFRTKQSTVSQLKVRFPVFAHVTMFEEDVKKVKLNETGRQNYCSYAKDVKL